MSRKRFILITYFFPPAPMAFSQRMAKLCKYLLLGSDWEPTVWCGEVPVFYKLHQDKELLKELPKEVVVNKIGGFLSSKLLRNLYKIKLGFPIRLVLKLFFTPDAFKDWANNVRRSVLKNHDGNFQFILASGPPNSVYYAAYKLSKILKIPYIMDMRDPWWAGKRKWYIVPFWIRNLNIKMEKEIYESAATIICNTEGNANNLRLGVNENIKKKIVVIPNGYDPDDLDPNQGPDILTNSKGFNLLYLGGYHGFQFEGFVFQVLNGLFIRHKYLKDIIKIHFVGTTSQEIQQIINRMGLSDNIIPYGIVDSNKIGKPMAQADAYIVLLPDDLIESSGRIPAKTFYYFAGKKPIIGFVPVKSELENILKKTCLSFIAPFGDINKGVEIMKEVFDTSDVKSKTG